MLVTVVGKFWGQTFKLFSSNHEYIILAYRYNLLLAFLITFSLVVNGLAIAMNVRLHKHPDNPVSFEIPRGREDDIDLRKRRLIKLMED